MLSRRSLFALMGAAAAAPMAAVAAPRIAERLTGGAMGLGMVPPGSVTVAYAGREFIFAQGGVIHFSGAPDYHVWCEGAEERAPHA